MAHRPASIALAVLGTSLLALAGCSWFSSKSLEAVTAAPRAGSIRVGVPVNYAPIAFTEKHELKGIEVDLARELVRETGMKVTVKQMDLDKLIPALLARKVDVVMAGLAVTDARAGEVSFIEPYLRTGEIALIRERDAGTLGQPSSLRTPGRRVGVVRGSSGERQVRAKLKNAEVIVFTSTADGMRALNTGRVDYFVQDEPSIWRFAASGHPDGAGLIALYTPLSEDYLAWAVRADDRGLKHKLDAAVLAMKQRGMIDVIIGRWVQNRVEATSVP